MTTWQNVIDYMESHEIESHHIAYNYVNRRMVLIESGTEVVVAFSSTIALKVLQKVNGDVSVIKGAR